MDLVILEEVEKDTGEQEDIFDLNNGVTKGAEERRNAFGYPD